MFKIAKTAAAALLLAAAPALAAPVSRSVAKALYNNG